MYNELSQPRDLAEWRDVNGPLLAGNVYEIRCDSDMERDKMLVAQDAR